MPGDPKNTRQNQGETNFLCFRECLPQDTRREQRDHQWHHARKECPRMCRGRELQSRIGQQNRCGTAKHDCRQSDTAKTFEGKALDQNVWQQKNPRDAKAKRRDVPGRQAGSEAKACDDDPSGPDADRGEAVERAAHIPHGGLATDRRVAHGSLLEQVT
jgi:hypothetical protein